jgi:hypothetical protein
MLRKLRLSIAILKLRWHASPLKKQHAIKQAIKQNKKNGKRYRVFFIGGQFRVWQRNDIRRLRNEGLFKSELKPGVDFDKIAIFDTLKSKNHVPIQ